MLKADFLLKLDRAKREVEQRSGVERYPFASLNNIEQVDSLCALAGLRAEDLHGGGRILDLGCGDGDVGFWLGAQGHAVDLVDFEETNRNRMRMALALHELLPGERQIYDVDIDRGLGQLTSFYSFAYALGLIYHLKNPFLVLSDLAERSSFATISTRIVQGELLPEGQACAYLTSPQELGADNTNYWLFNSQGLQLLAERSGWAVLSRLRTGDLAVGDAGQHDAREWLLLASKYSVFGPVVLQNGFHRVEFGTYRWTEQQFRLQVNCAQAGDYVLCLRYFLPEDWAGQHRLLAQIQGSGLKIEMIPAVTELLARLSFRADLPGRILVDFRCVGIPELSGDDRSLGIVLRFDSEGPPVWLEAK